MRLIFTTIFLFVMIPLTLSGQNKPKRILFFGDSITAGHGIDKENSFPAIIQQKVDSLDWNFKVVNAGLSGETSAGGLRRVDWVLNQPADIFILELGGNDGLRGIDPAATKKNLQEIIDKVEEKYPDAKIILAGMQVPPNLGMRYTEQFKEIYPQLVRENDIEWIPFLLKGVGGNPELNQSDGIHPTVSGHKVLAETVWKVLKPVLQEMRSSVHTN